MDDTKNGLVYFSLDEVGDVPSSVYRIENKDVRAPGPVYGSINNPTFEGAFNVAMADKISGQLETMRQEVAQNMFKATQEAAVATEE